MGFTNVVWESRDTVRLARDLTDGPGPASVGQAGAAWVRVTNEFAAASADYDKMVERLKTAWESESSAAAVRKFEEFGKWPQDMSLAAATNGQRAEEAAVANTEAVLAMPSVSEALAAKDTQDMMASLAAYNGAILNGNFAEFDEAAQTNQANAATVKCQYEDAVTPLAQPWEQPPPGQDSHGRATTAEQAAATAGKGAAGGGAQAAGLSDSAPSWLPTAHHNDASSVSWEPDSAIFDELAAPDEPEPTLFADEPGRTLEQVSARWVSPAVIGDGQLRL